MKKVLIVWADAEACEDRWSDLDEAKLEAVQPVASCTTIGFVLAETSERIVVTQTDGVDCVGPYISIPKNCIEKLVELYEH
tara:strand:+ start:452 stop:694 length:243 start_codon:yes stop_codon:yes gene_type:complete